MNRKINGHIESLKSSKQNDLMKWVKTIENQIESRIHISKFATYLDLAKQNKFQVPDTIKDMAEKAVRIGKELKKTVLNSKNSFEKLQKMKNQLKDQKIITNQMTHFEQAVSRSQEWIKKQIKFQQDYYFIQQKDGQDVYCLKNNCFFEQNGKIQYKALQSLVNEYNSLPLNYPSFQATTSNLYEQANKLISRIPSLNKMAKTRKAEHNTGVVKLPRTLIAELLNSIQNTPIDHEDFMNFQFSITDGLQQLQRIGMFLQDIRQQKTLKNLIGYQKLIYDIPIENSIQKVLVQKIEYYQLIDKIKKDISNPSKYQTLKQQLLKLKNKGFETEQHLKLQQRVMTCMGWHQSVQLIKQQRKVPNILFIVNQQNKIKKNMIAYESFKTQLELARNQLNVPEDTLVENQGKIQLVQEYMKVIAEMNSSEESNLEKSIKIFKSIYQNGLSFDGFSDFYKKLRSDIILLAKIQYLLLTSDEISPQYQSQFFLKNQQCQKIIDSTCDKGQVKDLRTKQTGDELIKIVQNSKFPKNMIEWTLFQQFMKKAQQWSEKALQIIERSKKNDDITDLRVMIQESKYCLHSKMIEQELNKIQIVLKWRQKIAKKMNQSEQQIFDTQDQQFMVQLQTFLQQQQTKTCQSQSDIRERALEFIHENGVHINSILQKISLSSSQELVVVKLSEMNKFVKEIDRQIQKFQLTDKVIDQLKQVLQVQLILNEDWKQRYFVIKRFQKKKMGQPHIMAARQAYYHNQGIIPPKQLHSSQQYSNSKRKGLSNSHINVGEDSSQFGPQNHNKDDISFDLMKDQRQDKQDSNLNCSHTHYLSKSQPMPYVPTILHRPIDLQFNEPPQKKKYFIQNGDFCIFFRMLLMLLEYYNGCRLKFVVEQFLKLKSTLIDIYKVIEKYNAVYEKSQKSDVDFQYLEAEAVKVPIFFKESYLIMNKNAQINSWKCMADHVLRSVPVINMQLKARKVQQLRILLQKKKIEDEKQFHQTKMVEQKVQQVTTKRRRKPNQLYQNDEMTLLKDDLLMSKTKKRRKNQSTLNSDAQYKNPAVTNGSTTLSHNNNKKLNKNTAPYQKEQKYQQQQRIDAFLNGQYNPQFVIDDPKQYCICRNGVPNENSLMMQCQNCDQWYHIECIGVKKHQAKNQQHYLCVACRSLSYSDQDIKAGGVNTSLGYFWDHYQRITQYALVQLYQEGKGLNVTTNQFSKLEIVYNAMMKWKQQTHDLMEKLIKDNPMSLAEYQSEIYPLFLQSMWLPTAHFETVHLRRLMKEIFSTVPS